MSTTERVLRTYFARINIEQTKYHIHIVEDIVDDLFLYDSSNGYTFPAKIDRNANTIATQIAAITVWH